MTAASAGRGAVAVITGEAGTGKSTLCARVVAAARDRGWRVAGICSPPYLVDGRKAGFYVEDAGSGERRLLGERRQAGATDPFHTQDWRFYQEALDWGTALLERSTPCDLLVIDELGPVELVRGQGWQAAFPALQSGAYRRALVVVRPSLLAHFRQRCPDLPGQVITVTTENRAALLPQLESWLEERP